MSYLNYKKVNNYQEYLEFCKSMFLKEILRDAYSTNLLPYFEVADTWIDFFEAYELNNEEIYDPDDNWHEIIRNYEGDVGRKPDDNQYPCLITYLFEDSWDRCGDSKVRMWDIIGLNEIK